MSIPDANAIGHQTVRLGLVSNENLQDCLMELPAKERTAEALLKLMERKALLTPFQVGKLLKGDPDGYILGGYRLLYKIASGTFGRVYRADDPRGGQTVAVKILRRKWSDNPRMVELFEREGKIGLTMKHPNIVEILAVNRDPASGQYYMVMEFVEGGNLRDFIHIRKKMEPKEALRMLEEMASGLDFAQSKGLTHRDLKPTNILVSVGKQAKLVDFGLAEITKRTAEEDFQNEQSVDYRGLEKITDCKPGDIRSDIYFLGCILYYMLKGNYLIEMPKDKGARKNPDRFKVAEKLDPNDPDLAGPVLPLLRRMVTLDPNGRHQNYTQLIEAIQHVRSEIDGGRTVATPQGQKTVFVIEHNEKLQDVFRERLKKYGFRVLISTDVNRAMTRFKQQPFTAMIVDVGTAGHEGIEVFEKVMDESEFTRTPLKGVLILNEDQGTLHGNVKVRPSVSVFVRPVSMKQILESLLDPESSKQNAADG